MSARGARWGGPRTLVLAPLALPVLLLVVPALLAQQPLTSRTVWDGVYTDAQATRGETRYQASCSGCHDEGPRRGDAFMRDWSGSDVGSLFNQIRKSMPPGAPASLTDAEYLDIIAYMLRVNGFPAGGGELTVGAIETVRIEGPNGPEPVPNFALVSVVGCLGAAAGTDWPLSAASPAARTKNPAASAGEELAGAHGRPLADQRYRLMNVFPRPEAYVGHKVEAKGFLIRDPAGDRINATSLQSLSPRCP